jgi:hypothetical protein
MSYYRVSKGFFKKPDFDMGASLFDRSAVWYDYICQLIIVLIHFSFFHIFSFKTAKKYDLAQNAFEKASEAHYVLLAIVFCF